MFKLVLEDLVYGRAKKIFDAAGIPVDVVAMPAWKRMLEAHLSEKIDSFIISADRFPEEFYGQLRKGSLIVRYGVGYDSVPVDLCRERGILVANTPGTLDQSVAEHAMALILALAKRLVPEDLDMKAGRWKPIMADELAGKTLAVVGFGSIGRTLARIARNGFGMKISAFDVNEKIREAFPDQFDVFSTDFAEAVKDADFVSLHVSLNPTTGKFMNAERISRLKTGAVLVNTARGGVVEEDALYAALASGALAFAGLDVFVNESYVPSGTKDLRTLSNVLLTPHVASNTVASNQRMAEAALRNVKAFQAGRLGELTLIPELRGPAAARG